MTAQETLVLVDKAVEAMNNLVVAVLAHMDSGGAPVTGWDTIKEADFYINTVQDAIRDEVRS